MPITWKNDFIKVTWIIVKLDFSPVCRLKSAYNYKNNIR